MSATGITGMGSIRQKRLPRGKLFGLGCDQCERRLNKYRTECKPQWMIWIFFELCCISNLNIIPLIRTVLSTPQLRRSRPLLRHWRSFVLGGCMKNRIKSASRPRAFYSRVKTLIQQFEELQQLRERVRRAEAKAVRAWRNQGRKQEKGSSSPPSGGRVH